MTLTPAMIKAQELHVARTINKPDWAIEDDERAAFRALNRVRASLTSDHWAEKILAFHKLYGVPVGDQGNIQQIPAFRKVLRERLLNEEVKETLEASEAGDLIETIDGLLDTIYVAIGWMIELGMTPNQILLAMEEVHASNMTKVDNDGRPVFDEGGKVLKGDNYTPVQLALVLEIDLGKETTNGEGDQGVAIPGRDGARQPGKGSGAGRKASTDSD